MDQLWRYILILIFLEIVLMTFILSLVSESPIAIINHRKRDNAHVHIQMKSNTTIKLIEDGIENGNKTVFAQLKKDLAVTSKLPKTKLRRNANANKNKLHKSSNYRLHALVKSKRSLILKSKHRTQHSGLNGNVTTLDATNKQNTTNGYESLLNSTSNVPMKNQTLCTFSFDENSLLQARRQLSQSISINLFYVNLNIEGFHSSINNVSDDILHWQYVLKDENFLVQLPVDFDLLTYGLLIHDHEETVLKVNLTYNKSDCLEKVDSEKIQIVRFLLWTELFHNDTKHYLCNRDFEKQLTRNFVYYLTTVWVGEDLICTGMSSDYGLYNIKAKKDHLPLVTPVFCYLLSLQFVWIFLLLDTIKIGNKRDTFVTESPEELKKCVFINLCPTFSQTNQKPSYTRNDKPYGLKQLVVKLLFRRTCCFEKSLLHNVHMRLLFIMWFFVLLPFGLYRTVGRYFLLKQLNEDYLNVFRPSEPFFYLFLKDKGTVCLAADACYATIFPFIYIFVGRYLYEIFMSKEKQQICCCFIEEEKEMLNADVDTISDRFTFRYSQFCRKVNQLLCPKDCCKETTGRKWCKDYFSCRCDSLCRDDICMCLYSSISVPFPVFPFVCFSHKYTCMSKCDNCKCKNCCWILLFIVRCVCNVVLFIILYILCLRPIFSTFTFMLRSFTHIFFVALPNRAAILRYTLLIFTTIAYFVKYIHQLINMNAEILNYIFKLKEEEISSELNNTENSDSLAYNVENVKEEMFDAIYDELTFVRKRFYFLYLKVVIVFMYLFITIETFITNTKALTGPNFQQILQFFLIIIGPYAISLFLKANKDDFLTEENKRDIKAAFIRFQSGKQNRQSDTLC